MRYPAAEKREIIRIAERSHLPVRLTLRHLGIPPATFYRWAERYQAGGPKALADRSSRPDRVWNRIPDAQRTALVDLALAEPELSPRELAVRFAGQQRYFTSEATVYRLLKAHAGLGAGAGQDGGHLDGRGAGTDECLSQGRKVIARDIDYE